MNYLLCGKWQVGFLPRVCFQLKASLLAFNCTLVAPSTHEADKTICSVSAQDIIVSKREKYIPLPGKDFKVPLEAHYGI